MKRLTTRDDRSARQWWDRDMRLSLVCWIGVALVIASYPVLAVATGQIAEASIALGFCAALYVLAKWIARWIDTGRWFR